MERLAKEKVAQQKRMLILRREMAAHTDQDPSFFLSDNEVASLGVGGNLRERCKPYSQCFSRVVDVIEFYSLI